MSAVLNEAAETDAWLQTYLDADPELKDLGVTKVMSTFFGRGRDPLPIVRYFLVEQDDLMVVGMYRVWSELVYQIDVVANGPDAEEAVGIANRLDALLHRAQPGDAGPIHIGEIWRRQPIFFKEKQSEDVYVHAGGEYVMHVYSL